MASADAYPVPRVLEVVESQPHKKRYLIMIEQQDKNVQFAIKQDFAPTRLGNATDGGDPEW